MPGLAQSSNRPTRRSGKKFPIYLVAAQGGGIYAAYHAASFLASVQDDCPRFGRHIFAISGVSGGSVGSSVFASLLYQANEAKALDLIADRPCRKTNDTAPPVFQDAVDELLSEDYLAPLLGGFLFTDAFQQILPRPVRPFDRARSLELGVEQSWQSIMGSKQFRILRGEDNKLSFPLSSRFISLWKPDSSPVPALVLNTTEVNTGRRRIVAPFRFDGIDVSFLPVWNDTDLAKRFPESVPDIPVSTAAFLSSRFPWVTPAGFFEDSDPNDKEPTKVRVVDGGYFENSGLATTLDLLGSLETALELDPALQPFRDKIEINIVTLNSRRFDLGSFAGFGEWVSPISTMMSTRSARAPLETSRAELLVERSTRSSTGIPKKLFRFDLDGLGYPLPLGWRLSAVTRLLIANQIGTRSRCRAVPAAGGEISPDCLKRIIADQLGTE
ncbi:patatin-like phospholipase family protein [Bradyrhizobium sp. BR 1433]|uniref:patatin-like phospholipase family protein n=1 Tax=Bradyrhizobium sp. BR 1433 TaxID=3447967 RepID=UPI003EE46CEC